MKALRLLALTSSLVLSAVSMAGATIPKDGRVDIWPTIPFVRGADLCAYKDAYGQSRSEYMNSMISQAKSLLGAGAKGKEALELMVNFSNMYDHNKAIAMSNPYLYDVTLESTLKAYVDDYYRSLKPKTQRLSFTHVNDIQSIVNAARNGMRDGWLDQNILNKLDYIAYGTYTLSPDCRSSILVTIHMIGRNGQSINYQAQGDPATVMSQIASRMFEDFQRTQFPSILKIGNKNITLVGGLNGTVDTVPDPSLAEDACSTLDARLPTQKELELISMYGDWNGGVSVKEGTWAMPDGKVFADRLRNPTPVREKWEVNADEFLYYCVR
jgi:hypothetical protein